MEVQFLLRSTIEGESLILVSASVHGSEWLDPRYFLSQLSRGVTEWVQTKPVAWIHYGQVFNVRDLNCHLNDKDLRLLLQKLGIQNLEIVEVPYPVSSSDWNTETVLLEMEKPNDAHRRKPRDR